MVTNEQVQAVTKIIVDHFEPQAVILFGSYGAGTATEASDIDLLVVKETDLPRHRRLDWSGAKTIAGISASYGYFSVYT